MLISVSLLYFMYLPYLTIPDYKKHLLLLFLLLLLLLTMYWFKWRYYANDAGALYQVIITVRKVV